MTRGSSTEPDKIPWHPELEEWTSGKAIAICAPKSDAIAVIIDGLSRREWANARLVCKAVNHHEQLVKLCHDLLEVVEAEFATDPAPSELPSWKRLIKRAHRVIDDLAKNEAELEAMPECLTTEIT